jgi:hypothetical protein
LAFATKKPEENRPSDLSRLFNLQPFAPYFFGRDSGGTIPLAR